MSSFLKWLSDKTNAPKARIPFTINKSEYFLGEEIKGEVCVISEEEFNASQLYMNLVCRESVKKTRTVTNQYGGRVTQRQEQYWDAAVLWSNTYPIFGTARIPKGCNSKYPFVFKIPSVARETYHSVDNNVNWLMNSVLQVNGRPNIQPQTFEVLVAKQPVSASVPISKEIIKEVVLIPCAYCGSLMPQTSIFCPHCGAKRKA
jgi:hypothetical protein